MLSEYNCPICMTELEASWCYCPQCGDIVYEPTKIPIWVMICQRCDTKIEFEWVYCVTCGHRLR